MSTVLIVLLIALAGAVCFTWGQSLGRWNGYHEGYEDGYGARWGRGGSGGDA